MDIKRFDELNKDAQLIYLKLKGSVIEEIVLDAELVKLYVIHEFLTAVIINKGNYSVKSILTIDTTEEKIWEDICIDSLFV